MFALVLALSYAGFAALCLSMNRHARDVLKRELADIQRLSLRVAGLGFLAASLLLATSRSGWPLGVVEWFGLLTAGAVSFVLLLTYLPRAAIALALCLPVLALIHDRYTAWLSP